MFFYAEWLHLGGCFQMLRQNLMSMTKFLGVEGVTMCVGTNAVYELLRLII